MSYLKMKMTINIDYKHSLTHTLVHLVSYSVEVTVAVR